VKKMLAEFKDFIAQDDLIMIAVGLIMALYVKAIVDALISGVINPIIAAIFGKPDFSQIGFDIGKSRISIGLVINAGINFVIVGFILFLIVRAYNKMKARSAKPAGPTGPTEVDLLTEIRDALRSR
jgi:large conductance mechanosensitive channel